MKLTDAIRRERDALAVRFIESGGKLPWLETLRLTALVALGGEFADSVKQAMFVAGARAGVVLEWKPDGPTRIYATYPGVAFVIDCWEPGGAFILTWLFDGADCFSKQPFNEPFAAKVRALEIVHEMSTGRQK